MPSGPGDRKGIDSNVFHHQPVDRRAPGPIDRKGTDSNVLHHQPVDRRAPGRRKRPHPSSPQPPSLQVTDVSISCLPCRTLKCHSERQGRISSVGHRDSSLALADDKRALSIAAALWPTLDLKQLLLICHRIQTHNIITPNYSIPSAILLPIPFTLPTFLMQPHLYLLRIPLMIQLQQPTQHLASRLLANRVSQPLLDRKSTR